MGTTLVGEAVGILEGSGDGRNEGARLREGRAVGETVGARVAAVGACVEDGATVGLRDELAVLVVSSRNSFLAASGRSLSLSTC